MQQSNQASKLKLFQLVLDQNYLVLMIKKNTRWKFSLIPLGGYVKMKGELFNSIDNSNNMSLTKDTFTEASLLSRFIIVASGPLANLIFGSFLITSLYTFNGKYVSTSIIDTVIDAKTCKISRNSSR